LKLAPLRVGNDDLLQTLRLFRLHSSDRAKPSPSLFRQNLVHDSGPLLPLDLSSLLSLLFLLQLLLQHLLLLRILNCQATLTIFNY
jgi:hypothetical protein